MKALAAAVERGDHATALTLAIESWRAHRSVALAELVDALAAKLSPAPIPGQSKASFQKAFVARARDEDVATPSVLADGLAQRVPIRETDYLAKERDRKRHTFFLARIEALAARDPDSRIARALVDVIAKAPFSVDDGASVYGPVIELLIVNGDDRSALALEALVDKPIAKTRTLRDYFATALPKAIAKLRKKRPKGPTLDGLLATLVGPAPVVKRASDLDALLAECLANPDDDAPRLVYADALLEADDPRGEFIQLQMRELSEVDAKRAASIQRKHEKAWLGDIARVTKLRVFRRGFLDEAELLQGAAAEPATWKAVAADPRMATVRILNKGKSSEELYRSFVFSPALKSLRSFTVPSNAMLAALGELDRKIDSISLSSIGVATLKILEGKPLGIRRLAFDTFLTPRQLVDHVLGWAGRTQFEELVARPAHRVGDPWHEDDLTWLFAFDKLGVKRLGRGDHIYGNRIVVARTKAGVEIDIVANQEWLILRMLTRDLPLPVTKLVVRGNPQVWFEPGKDFAKAVKKHAAIVELRDRWASVDPRRE